MAADTWEDKVRVVYANYFVELPWLVDVSLNIAVFRTFGIPSISEVLRKSGGYEKHLVRRVESTEVLISEFTANAPCSDDGAIWKRFELAVRRLNYLHGRYRAMIPHEDFVYVLSLFVVEPIRWCRRYSPLLTATRRHEEVAFEMWKEIGTAMDIKDVPASLDALMEFHDRYEAANMRPAESNGVVMNFVLEYMYSKWSVPAGPLRGIFLRLLGSFVDEPLRVALGYPREFPVLGPLLRGAVFLVYGMAMPLILPTRPWRWAKIKATPDAPGSVDLHRLRPIGWVDVKPNDFEPGYRVLDLGADPTTAGRVAELGPLLRAGLATHAAAASK